VNERERKRNRQRLEIVLGNLSPADRRELELFTTYKRLVSEAVRAGCTRAEAERAIYPDVYACDPE
jgi:hypothetical protein